MKFQKVLSLAGLVISVGALGGGLAASLLLIEHPSFRTAVLLGLAIWCSARFYYFAFYVIEHYVDGQYHFAGLWSFVRFLQSRLRRSSIVPDHPPKDNSQTR